MVSPLRFSTDDGCFPLCAPAREYDWITAYKGSLAGPPILLKDNKYSKITPMRRRSNKTIQKRRNNHDKTARLLRLPTGVPDRMLIRLRYSERQQNPATALDYVYNLNSIYDPNLTGTGHQPLGRDQWASFYNRYRVIKVNCLVRALCTGATERYFGVVANNDTTAFTVFDTACESPHAKFWPLVQAAPISYSMNLNLPSINGRTYAEYVADDRYASTFGASPAETIALHVFYANSDGTSVAVGGITFDITFTYDLELFDPVQLAQS